MKKIMYSLLASSLVIAGCEKEDSLPIRYSAVGNNSSYLKVFHVSPDAPAFNLFVNGAKATSVAPSSTNEVQGIAFGGIFPSTATTIGYFAAPSGSVKLDGMTVGTTPTTIFSKTETLTANRFYSYAIADSLSKLQTVLIEDDPTVEYPTRSYFRVVNLIPNGNVKVQIIRTAGASYTKDINTLPFKTVTPFDTVATGGGELYKIYLINATNNQKLDSVSNLAPVASKKYTFYTRGVIGQTGSTNTKRPLIFGILTF